MLQKGVVRWNEISQYQGTTLPPAREGLDFSQCNIAIISEPYGFRHAGRGGWRDRVAFMREAMHFSIFLGPHFSDQDAADVASYLTSLFGPDSVLPKSPSRCDRVQGNAAALQ